MFGRTNSAKVCAHKIPKFIKLLFFLIIFGRHLRKIGICFGNRPIADFFHDQTIFLKDYELYIIGHSLEPDPCFDVLAPQRSSKQNNVESVFLKSLTQTNFVIWKIWKTSDEIVGFLTSIRVIQGWFKSWVPKFSHAEESHKQKIADFHPVETKVLWLLILKIKFKC